MAQKGPKSLGGKYPFTLPSQCLLLCTNPNFQDYIQGCGLTSATKQFLSSSPKLSLIKHTYADSDRCIFRTSWPASLVLGPSREEREKFSRFPSTPVHTTSPLTCSPFLHFWKLRRVEQLLL